MTDPNDLDELASAHLDGQTSPEEAARVAADPDLLVRVEELRAVREALAQVASVEPVQRDAAVAAALAAFDEEGTGDPSTASVTPLAPRRRLSPTAARAVGVAAIVLLIALLVPLLATLDRDDAASFRATGDAIESPEVEEGGAEAAQDSTADGATSTSTSPQASAAGPVDLGTFDDLDDLAAVVTGRQLQERAVTDFSESAAAQTCATGSSDGSSAVAIVAGRPVAVYLRSDPDGSRTMIVLAQDTCELLAEREL